jgi:hypothetical protein
MRSTLTGGGWAAALALAACAGGDEAATARPDGAAPGAPQAAASGGTAAPGSKAAPARDRAPPGAAPAADAAAAAAALGVPLYPGATLVSAIVGDAGGAGGAIVTIETRAPPADVARFYRERLAAAGYAIRAEANVGTVRLIGGETPARSLAVQVSAREGGGSTVALTAGGR